MKRRLVYSNESKADLAEAKVYSIGAWGHAQARRYLSGLISDIKALQKSALRYPLYDLVQPGLRRKRSGMHHIYYLVFEGRIVIVRIIHVQRDAGLHLKVETWSDEGDE